jgi:TPR repeat protein
MKRLLTTLVILTGLIGSGGAVWAQDYEKGMKAYQSGDFATALKEWKPLAEWGIKEVQHNLGFMYEKGKGVTQDYSESLKWYRKAAEQGYAKAQYNLGVAYANGEGVTQDDAEALKWYRKAAEQGLAEAQKQVERLAPLTTTGDTIPLASEMQRKANAACVTVTSTDGYKNPSEEDTFVVNSVTQGLDNWVSATMTGLGYIDNFYYNTKTNTSICGSNTFRERGFNFIHK